MGLRNISMLCLLACTTTWAGEGLTTGECCAAEPSAPDGPVWHFYGGHRYALTESSGSWDAAWAEAASYGGSLVTIDDTEENDWLVLTFGPEWLWIGLSQASGAAEPADGWEWASGNGVVYENWAAGQPDNMTGADDYAMMNVEGDLGRWHDIPGGGWPPESPGKRGIIEVALPGPGDADGDGDVDLDDFVIFKTHYGSTGATWAQGDFDGDGDVDLDDFVILKRNFSAAATGTP